MRLFVSSLSSPGELPPDPVVENPFSQAVEIVYNNEDTYAHIEMVNDRAYILYRASLGHDYYDGRIYMVYSDDDGQTWTNQGEVYDGQHVLTDNPQYEIDMPGCMADCRDSVMQVSGDGTHMLMIVPVAVGQNTGGVGVGRDTLITRSVCVKIPIIGSDLDYANQVEYYVSPNNLFVSETLFNLNGVTYTNGNNRALLPEPGNEFYKSLDYGETWTLVSYLFVQNDPIRGSEVGIDYIDGGLIAMGRTADGSIQRMFCRSNDLGVTWIDYQISSEWTIHAMHLLDLGGGKFVSVGRESSADATNLRSMLATFNASDYSYTNNSILYTRDNQFDKGYGNTVKYRDKYFTTWSSSGGHIWFRQLNYLGDGIFEYGND